MAAEDTHWRPEEAAVAVVEASDPLDSSGLAAAEVVEAFRMGCSYKVVVEEQLDIAGVVGLPLGIAVEAVGGCMG